MLIEMYHPVHARVHPCAADESELVRLLAMGWVRTREELDLVRPGNDIIDEFDLRVNEMLEREEAEERRASKKVSSRMLRQGGSSTPEIR